MLDRRSVLAGLGLAGFTGLAPARAQAEWPSQLIRLVVPFTAGGTSDVIARAVADQMSAALGQSIIIENVGGAGGSTSRT